MGPGKDGDSSWSGSRRGGAAGGQGKHLGGQRTAKQPPGSSVEEMDLQVQPTLPGPGLANTGRIQRLRGAGALTAAAQPRSRSSTCERVGKPRLPSGLRDRPCGSGSSSASEARGGSGEGKLQAPLTRHNRNHALRSVLTHLEILLRFLPA